MLLSLQIDLWKDFHKTISRIQSQIDDLVECTEKVKHQLSKYPGADNDLVDAHQSHIEEPQCISAKLPQEQPQKFGINLSCWSILLLASIF